MSRKDIDFDLNQALEDLKAGKPMNGKDGFLTPLVKQPKARTAIRPRS